jgi:pantoate--beta-alanine ligase
MQLARTRQELDAVLKALRHGGGTVNLVPTMGALHAGHIALVARARQDGARCIASIFVNPLQFSQTEDLQRYPRDEDGDLRKLEQAGCDAVWLPSAETMYPDGDVSTVDVAGPAIGWEGDARPGHFRGVATVVTKLFGQTRPDAACFGEKDFQQLQVIRRIARDLCLGVRIIGVPTLREADGLAMSSRNRFLSPEDRGRAPLLHAELSRVATDLRAGAAPDTAVHAARARLAAHGLLVDYLALVDGETLARVPVLAPGARLIAAARLGNVRLLDNINPV